MTKKTAETRRPTGFNLASASVLFALIAGTSSPGLAETVPTDRPTGAEAPTEQAVDIANYLMGRFAFDTFDHARAAEFFDAALGEDPNNRALQERTFLLMLGEGRWEDTVRLADGLDGPNAEAALAKLVMALDAVAAQEWDQAQEEIEKIDAEALAELVVPLIGAWAKAAEDDGDGAVAILEPLGKQRGFETMKTAHEALIMDLLGNDEKARPLYIQLTAGDRIAPRMALAAGSFFERQGDVDTAKGIYEKVLALQPDSLVMERTLERVEKGEDAPPLVGTPAEGVAEGMFDIASAFFRQNHAQASLIYLRLALRVNSDLEAARLLAADVLESLGREADAIAELEMIPADSAYSWLARLRTAENLRRLDRIDEAAEALETLASEREMVPDPLIQLGDLYRASERFAESAAAYDRAFERIEEIDQRHWPWLYSRGISLERSKDWPRAEADFLKALELQPDQPYVLNYLGYSWIDQGIHLERAKKMVERAVELRPRDGYIVDSLGWALFKLNDYKGAVQHLERAVELRPQDPVINDHLGDALWKVGRMAEARFQWERALSLEPDDAEIEKIERKLLKGLIAEDGETSDAQGG